MVMRTFGMMLAGLIVLAAPGAAPAAEPAPAQDSKISTLYILVDGLRADQVTAATTPHLDRLAQAGARGGMIPVWPSISTPNHWALATGLLPIHSGLINNGMYDPRSKTMLDPTEGGPFWGNGEAIWSTVARNGGISGMIGYWAGWRKPGAEHKPSWQMYYTLAHGGHDGRADIALSVLEQDVSKRPDLLTLYFGELDHEEHGHGVGSPEGKAMLTHIDGVIGEIVSGLAQRKLADKVNIVIVADHGMIDVGAGQAVYLEDIIDLRDLDVVPAGGGGIWALWPKPGKTEAMVARLRQEARHYKVYQPGDVPARMKCCDPAIAPPILVTADPGWMVYPKWDGKAEDKGKKIARAMHGYDNQLPEMRAAFIAAGPSIRSGQQVGTIQNVDVYPLLTHLLKVKPQPNDGSTATLCAIAVSPPAGCTGK